MGDNEVFTRYQENLREWLKETAAKLTALSEQPFEVIQHDLHEVANQACQIAIQACQILDSNSKLN